MKLEPPNVGCYGCHYTTIALLALAVLLAGCGAKPGRSQANPPETPAAQVRVATVRSQKRMVTEEVAATVRARRHATLEAKLSGRIEAMPVALGDHVKAGQLLATLDAAEIKARYDQSVASLDQADQDWKRITALYEQKCVTQAEYESAQARQRIARGAQAEARAMMNYVEIPAPFDGVVTIKWADVGDLAAPGKPLLEIQDPSSLQLEADVPEAIGGGIQLGAQLEVKTGAAMKSIVGSVSEISPAADPVSRTFRVKLDLPSSPALMPGQFARLIVPAGESRSLRTPTSALVQRGQLEMVFVEADQHAQLRLVKSGVRIGDEVEILSGLDSGEKVVVGGAERLVDGQLVQVR